LVEIWPTRVIMRVWPYLGPLTWFLLLLFGSLSGLAVTQGEWQLALGLALPSLVALVRAVAQAGESLGGLLPIASGECWTLSEWDEFSPPGHFFEIPWTPR
jgi:hypothetical protein